MKNCLNFRKVQFLLMKDISLKRNINFENKTERIKGYDSFSLKLTDSLYKKDIGKFLEILSSHFIQKNKNV